MIYSTGFVVVAVLGVYSYFMVVLYVTENHWSDPKHQVDSTDVRSLNPQKITLIDIGYESLLHRLEMIQSSKKSLDLEFFIYEIDSASRILTNALIEKAKQGVKVRVLVDFAKPVFKLSPYYAKVLMKYGVEVKYYNTSSLSKLFNVQHRTHRKLLSVDDRIAMIGGRNIANDYFDMPAKWNFLDSDIMIEGDLVTSIRKSFDLYWDSTWSVNPETVEVEMNQAQKNLFKLIENDHAMLDKLKKLQIEPQTSECKNSRFVTDYPGSAVSNRRVFSVITELVQETKDKMLIESPYLVLTQNGRSILKSISDRGIKMTILTNSLASTDGYYTISALYPDISELKFSGFKLFAYDGKYLENYPESNATPSIWTIHSKRAVIDDKVSILGTYNLDPRSANLNSELVFICYDGSEFANQLSESMIARRKQAKLVVDETGSVDHDSLIGETDSEYKWKMFMVIPIAYFFNFLF